MIISEPGDEILPQSILDLQHQSHDEDLLIDVLPILRVEVAETTDTMALMGETMMIDETEVAMREGMIGDSKEAFRKSLPRIERQSANESWQKCNRKPRN